MREWKSLWISFWCCLCFEFVVLCSVWPEDAIDENEKTYHFLALLTHLNLSLSSCQSISIRVWEECEKNQVLLWYMYRVLCCSIQRSHEKDQKQERRFHTLLHFLISSFHATSTLLTVKSLFLSGWLSMGWRHMMRVKWSTLSFSFSNFSRT